MKKSASQSLKMTDKKTAFPYQSRWPVLYARKHFIKAGNRTVISNPTRSANLSVSNILRWLMSPQNPQ